MRIGYFLALCASTAKAISSKTNLSEGNLFCTSKMSGMDFPSSEPIRTEFLDISQLEDCPSFVHLAGFKETSKAQIIILGENHLNSLITTSCVESLTENLVENRTQHSIVLEEDEKKFPDTICSSVPFAYPFKKTEGRGCHGWENSTATQGMSAIMEANIHRKCFEYLEGIFSEMENPEISRKDLVDNLNSIRNMPDEEWQSQGWDGYHFYMASLRLLSGIYSGAPLKELYLKYQTLVEAEKDIPESY